jgi:flagellar protein FliL
MSDTPTEPTPPPKRGKGRKMLMMGVVALTLVGAGAGAGVYAIGAGHEGGPKEDPNRPKLVEKSEAAEPTEAGEGAAAKEAPPKIGTVAVKSDSEAFDKRKFEVTYYHIDQNFTANLADGGGFVQIGLSVGTYFDGKVIANVKRQIVPIRSAILMLLSEQDAAALATSAGKQILQKQLTKAINGVLREQEGFGGIDNVYFTTLVIQ